MSARLQSDAASAAETARLQALLAERDSAIEGLRDEVRRLAERIAELERMLSRNSRNSGKPPSSDGLSKPKSAPKGKGGRRPGGQPGHPGSTLKPSEDPDRIVEHMPEVCGGCGAGTVADFPRGVDGPVQYGPRIVSLILYFSTVQLMPLKRLRTLLADVFGVSMSQGTIHAAIRRAAGGCAGFWRQVREMAAKAPVKHFDETGMRVAGSLRWVHVACTALLCHFRLGDSRGDVMAEAAGIAVHDHWKPCFRIEGVEHGACLAHLMRELAGLVESDDEIRAENMRDHLRSTLAIARDARRRRAPPADELVAAAERHCDLLVGDGIAHREALPPLSSKRKGRPKRRPGHNLAIRLRDFKAGTLRFLRDPSVPATNNLAERDIRPLKVKQKISGSFRTEAGAREFAILRSTVETARKQGWNLLSALQADPDMLAAALRADGPAPED